MPPTIRDVVWVWDEGTGGGPGFPEPKQGRLVYVEDGGDVVGEQSKKVEGGEEPDVLHLRNGSEVVRELEVISWQGRDELKAIIRRCINIICPHSINVGPPDTSAPLHPRPSPLRCSECNLTANLWVCLTCAYVGCGRISSGAHHGHGSNGHALRHWSANPSHFLCVKLGTITKVYADAHCYSCGQLVQVVGLTEKLERIGIDRNLQKRTSTWTWDWEVVEEMKRKEREVTAVALAGGAGGGLGMLGTMPGELICYVLMWVGGPADIQRGLGKASKMAAGTVRDAFSGFLTRLDLSGRYADSFFSFNQPFNLRTLTFTDYTPRGGFTIPLYLTKLRYLTLDKPRWWGVSKALLLSLPLLPSLTSLSISYADISMWDTLHDTSLTPFKSLTALDISNSFIECPGLEALLGLCPNIRAIRLTQASDVFEGTQPDDTAEIFETVKKAAPNITTLCYVGFPYAGGPDTSDACRTLLEGFPNLEYVLCRPLVVTPTFIQAVPSSLPKLRLLDLLSASTGVTSSVIRHLLLSMPSLQVCPLPQHLQHLPPGRAVSPVYAQTYFSRLYLDPPPPPPDSASWAVDGSIDDEDRVV